MLKTEVDHISLDILKSSQMASTQIEKAAYQMTKEADAQSLNSYLDVDCFKKMKEQIISLCPLHKNTMVHLSY